MIRPNRPLVLVDHHNNDEGLTSHQASVLSGRHDGQRRSPLTHYADPLHLIHARRVGISEPEDYNYVAIVLIYFMASYIHKQRIPSYEHA